ncbi:MAG: tetratricopeptide repeat protein [Candidatus Paceibacterota bacterium]
MKKQISLPENKYVKWLFIATPVAILLSSLFSGSLSVSFFGKYISIQNAASFLSIAFLVYILSAYLKKFKRFAWTVFMVSNFLLTLPVILAVLFSKFNLFNIANKLVIFVDNWDTVAIISSTLLIVTLVYFETIAFSRKQKIISASIIFIHLILIICIIIPDIWYALAFSSLGILLISLFTDRSKNQKINIYKKLSLYVFIISIFFALAFTIQNSKIQNFSKKIINFTEKYSGIHYNFVKPKLGISLDLGFTELRKGKIFGSGPASFDSVWQKEKPDSVIASSYWNTTFTSSYSAFTTLLVTLGIVGILLLLLIIVTIFISIIKSLKKDSENSYLGHDDEDRFYFISSVALFIFSTTSMFVFTNIVISIIIFSLSVAFVTSNTTTWKDKESTKLINGIFLSILIIALLGTLISINRVRSTSVSLRAINNYQIDNDISKLESGLRKAARLSGDDNDYRTLTQFYIYKAGRILNSTPATSTANELQKNILDSVNEAISSANTAINIDNQNYNNYITLGSVYNFLMSIGGQNRDSYYQKAKDNYSKALNLYPKDPSTSLTMASLEYSYNQNATTTLENIKRALNIKPNFSTAYYVLSQLAVQYNDRNSAIQYAAQAIQTDPKNIEAYMQYGILVLNKKDLNQDDLNQAYSAFMSVLNIDPNNVTAAYYLSITYILAKDFDHAQSLINILQKVLPNDQKIKDLQSFLNTQKNGVPTASTTKKTIKK